ncbi:MAG: response regulator transcription factor [Rhodospirillales bacterium]|nr:response regulator transcription factor [Rhodospirillales bacterium]
MTLTRCILVIDDEEIFLKTIENALLYDGHQVVLADTATKGLQALENGGIDLIILDLNLPDINGIEMARWVRAESDVPILMLTGVAAVGSRVRALNAGADDYLIKPFDPNELNARVRSLLRRFDMGSQTDKEVALSHGDWRLMVADACLVSADGTRTPLTEREVMVLATLMRRPGTIIPRDELTHPAAGREWQSIDRSLDVHISHLRKKIGAITPGKPSPIRTIRSRGFIYDPDAL